MSTTEDNNLSQAHTKLKEQCLYFLDATNCLKDIDCACYNYENKIKNNFETHYFTTLHYPIEIDLKELQNISDTLYRLFINEPPMAKTIIHNVIYSFILSKLSLDDFKLSQLHVSLKIKAANSLPLSNSTNIPIGRLTLLHGSIFSISTRRKYIQSYVAKCVQLSCPNGLGQRICGYVPVRMPLCSICGSAMQEIPEAQETGEQIIALFVKLPKMQKNVASRVREQAILVCFQDDLMSGLEPGLQYEIAGYKEAKYFQALSVTPRYYLCKEIKPKIVPASICKLHQYSENTCPNSPWAFVGTLAGNLEVSNYPACCYFNLKMGLLLSLASQRPGTRPIPILATGTDTHIAHRLMHKAAALTNRGAVLEWARTSPNPHFYWETPGLDVGWIEAGPLLLASGGVCLLGDWAKLKGKSAQVIISALDTAHVMVESNKALNIPLSSYPLRCSVWTYMLRNKKQSSKIADQTRALIQVFGIPFLATDQNSVEMMAYFTLLKHLKSTISNYEEISDSDFTEYLALVTSRNPRISVKASQLIKDYFVASRRVYPDNLPVNAVSIITALSEGYARLALQDEVIPQHVAAVIQLYEEALTYMYGKTVVSSPPTIKPCSDISYWVHHTLEDFIPWLENFIHGFGGSNSQIHEESLD